MKNSGCLFTGDVHSLMDVCERKDSTASEFVVASERNVLAVCVCVRATYFAQYW